MNQQANSDKSRRGIARRLALSGGILIVLLLLVELAVRTRQYIQYGTFGAMHVFELDEKSGLLIPPPGRVTKNFTINELGFRGPLLEIPKPTGRLRLAFLGASTTFCAEASSEAVSWPARIAAAISAQVPGIAVDYLNAGVGGHLLEQIHRNLESRVAPFEPDVIFIYEATNDLTRDTREIAVAQHAYTGHADRESWLSAHALTWYLIEKNLLLRSRKRDAISDQAHIQFDPREVSIKFRARLGALCDAAKSRSKLVVLMTFSTQARRGQDPERLNEACNTSFYYMPYMTAELLLDTFDEYNRVIREVALEKDVLLLDVAAAVPGDREHFSDSVHFKDRGCAVFAEAILAELNRSPRWKALLAR